jgi:hypothetical protein
MLVYWLMELSTEVILRYPLFVLRMLPISRKALFSSLKIKNLFYGKYHRQSNAPVTAY